MIFGSVCSGIEAASVAWEPLGWRACWFAEVDEAASAVLRYRWPSTPNHGDMTKLAGMVRRREIPAPDALVGGTPCQSFSVAGMRQGLADPRGQLTLAFVDLANAIDEVRAAEGLPPCIIVWENVPGALSSKDNAFGCFLAGIAGEDQPLLPAGRKWTNAGVVLGPQRAIAWRVLDAQFFGLAQRRRRVFVVAGAGEGFDPGALLLEFDGVRRDSAPSRESGEGVAGTLDARTQGGGFPGTDGACSGHVVPGTRGDVVADAGGRTGAARDSDDGLRGSTGLTPTAAECGGGRQGGALEIAPCCTSHGVRLDFDTEAFIVHGTQDPCTSESDAFALGRNNGGENVIAFSSKDFGGDATAGLSPTLRASGHGDSHANGGSPPAVAYAIQERAICENPAAGPDGVGVRTDDCAYTLEARTVPQAVAVLPFDTTQITSPNNYSAPKTGDPCHPLAAGAHPPAVCVTGSVTHTLKAEGFDASEDGTGRGQPIVCGFQASQSGTRLNDTAGTLDANYGPRRHNGALVDMAVRRLMPVECERLQGFPDNHTRIPVRHYAKRAITKNRPADMWEADERGGLVAHGR